MKKCVMCDRIEPDHKTNCSGCGAYLISLPDKPKTEERSLGQKRLVNRCKSCGRDNYGDRTKCVDCGVELDIDVQTVTKRESCILGPGHYLSILVTAALMIFCVRLAGWSTEATIRYYSECPDFFPFIYMEEVGTFFMLAFGAVGLIAVVFLFGLLGKQRWAGEKIHLPYGFAATVLGVVEIWNKWLVSQGDDVVIFDEDSLVLWLIVGGMMVAGKLVSLYYKENLDCMMD